MNQPVLALSAVLFALGLFGLTTRRNVILLFLSMELMLVSV
ncbi:MAG: NADH-quinone oxidoreductase subunit K, partial [Pirellulaceae bacterium]